MKAGENDPSDGSGQHTQCNKHLCTLFGDEISHPWKYVVFSWENTLWIPNARRVKPKLKRTTTFKRAKDFPFCATVSVLTFQIPICSKSHLFAKNLQAFLKLPFSKNNIFQNLYFRNLQIQQLRNLKQSIAPHTLPPTSSLASLSSANPKCVFWKSSFRKIK